jgi:hypothetical protein
MMAEGLTEVVRASRRQVAWLFVVVLIDAALLSVTEDPMSSGLNVIVLIVPLVGLVGRDLRVRTIQLEARFWNWWRGSSIFDTAVRALFVAPFYPFIPLVSLGLHLAAARRRRHDGRRSDASARAAASDPEVVAAQQEQRGLRIALALYVMCLGVMAVPFWIFLATDPALLRADPAFTAMNLVLQVLILVPGLFAFDRAYRIRFVGVATWLLGQWRSSSDRFGGIIGLVSLPLLIMAAFLAPVSVVILHLVDRRRPGLAATSPVVVAPSSAADVAPPAADPAPEAPPRRAWGGGQSAG